MTLITPEGPGESLYSSWHLIVVIKEEKWLKFECYTKIEKIDVLKANLYILNDKLLHRIVIYCEQLPYATTSGN